MKATRMSGILLVGALLLSACGGNGSVSVQDAWARPAAAGANAAVYFQLHNGSGQDDVLLGASSDSARAVELHESMVMGTEDMEGMSESDQSGEDMEGMQMGDVMQMVPVESLTLGAGQDVVFEPGGYHVMLIDLPTALQEGDQINITLHFQQAGDIEVPVSVEVH